MIPSKFSLKCNNTPIGIPIKEANFVGVRS